MTNEIGYTLIQRLDIPRGSPFPKAFTPFGAFRTGGFSCEALDLLQGIFDFDYMGSAEYECGECPQALATIWAYAGEGKLRRGVVRVPRYRHHVYYICKSDIEGSVIHAISKLAAREKTRRIPEELDEIVTRDYVGLHDALLNPPHKPGETAGWLDISHACMFFVSRDMYRKTLQLFAEPLRKSRRVK